MRLAKYTPSKQELEMLMKCRREMLVSYAKAAFFSSAVAWTVSYRLKFFNRVFLTAVASFVGVEIGRQRAEQACMKDFLSLQESPVRGELIAILQRDYPNNPLLRKALQNDEDWKSIYDIGDEIPMSRLPLQAKEGQFPGDMQRDNTKDDDGAVPVLTREERQSSESWDEPRHLVTRDNHVDRQGFRKLPANRFGGDKRWELSEGKENLEGHAGTADFLVNPFNLSVWMDTQDVDEGEERGDIKGKERRRSHMTAKERREHNRKLYLNQEQNEQNLH
jgi:hypothetical protein